MWLGFPLTDCLMMLTFLFNADTDHSPTGQTVKVVRLKGPKCTFKIRKQVGREKSTNLSGMSKEMK